MRWLTQNSTCQIRKTYIYHVGLKLNKNSWKVHWKWNFKLWENEYLRWPTSVTAKEKSSQQEKNFRGKKEIGHGKRKKLPVKEKLPRQKKNARGKKEIGHGKRKKLPAKEKLPHGKKEISAAKEKCSRQKEIGHGKREIPAAK